MSNELPLIYLVCKHDGFLFLLFSPLYHLAKFLVCWQGVLDGKYDDLPEQAFYLVGGIEEVIAKAEKIAKESAA